MKKRFLTGVLALSLMLPGVPVTAAVSTTEIVLPKDVAGNPVFTTDASGKRVYGADPSVLVDGDRVYLYAGHDESSDSEVDRKIYNQKEYICYSTTDMKTWKPEGSVMKVSTDAVKWARDSSSSWASQVTKYNGRYYLYFCTWDKTSQGKQSIGVAVADKPTGPFKDIGAPLVKGSLTKPQNSDWDDIDPTVWVDTDSKGVEHRYLAWGNSQYYVCELNKDMISVKDLNGDGKITCGTDSRSADIINRSPAGYTEAPWIYRRKDAKGKYYGEYYLFYASGWHESMAYSTTSDLINGEWNYGKILMPPNATSNTNHMAVFDFKGKTYFAYHNGSQPGGNGYRRIPCITELHFEKDGSIREIPETASGLTGTTSTVYTSSGARLSHETYVNSHNESDYPYKDVRVGAGTGREAADAKWLIMAGKADRNKGSYVSIQSENKPGLYITANSASHVTLAQDTDASAETARRQTFRTVQGLAGSKGVSFESVAYPGYFLTIVNGTLTLRNGADREAATFYTSLDKGDSSLRSIAATVKKNQVLQGTALAKGRITLTLFYANGVTKKTTDFTTNAASFKKKKPGKYQISVTYKEGSVQKTTMVPVTIVVKPVKVKTLKAKVTVGKKKTKVKLSWKKAKGQKYEISYGKKKKQHKKLGTVKITKKTAVYSRSRKTWKKGKSYYFHIRTYSKVNGVKKYSSYRTRKVKIK